jgi:hypothetical protein
MLIVSCDRARVWAARFGKAYAAGRVKPIHGYFIATYGVMTTPPWDHPHAPWDPTPHPTDTPLLQVQRDDHTPWDPTLTPHGTQPSHPTAAPPTSPTGTA